MSITYERGHPADQLSRSSPAMVYRDLVGSIPALSDCNGNVYDPNAPLPLMKDIKSGLEPYPKVGPYAGGGGNGCWNAKGLFNLTGVHIPGLAQTNKVPLVDSMVVSFEHGLMVAAQRLITDN